MKCFSVASIFLLSAIVVVRSQQAQYAYENCPPEILERARKVCGSPVCSNLNPTDHMMSGCPTSFCPPENPKIDEFAKDPTGPYPDCCEVPLCQGLEDLHPGWADAQRMRGIIQNAPKPTY